MNWPHLSIAYAKNLIKILFQPKNLIKYHFNFNQKTHLIPRNIGRSWKLVCLVGCSLLKTNDAKSFTKSSFLTISHSLYLSPSLSLSLSLSLSPFLSPYLSPYLSLSLSLSLSPYLSHYLMSLQNIHQIIRKGINLKIQQIDE